MFAKVSLVSCPIKGTGVLKFCASCRSQSQLSGAPVGGGAGGVRGAAGGGSTHRRVGPIQLVSVLSISRSMRSCSAAVSTLAILHVAPVWTVRSGLAAPRYVTQEEPRGALDVFTEQPERAETPCVSGFYLLLL